MIFVETQLSGAYVIELQKIEDDRGFFARTFCIREFQKKGLAHEFVQSNLSWNNKKGIVRGMHYQCNPHEEAKLVRCSLGRIYDVIIDLRPTSPSFRKWIAVELSAENKKTLFIPTGFAHGFQTLTENSEVLYHMSEFYYPECSRGVRWNDPQFAIKWPIAEKIISKNDQGWDDYRP